MTHARPEGVSDATVAAVGKASEALEFVERIRGHLFSVHQLMGRADFLFEDAADLLDEAGHPTQGDTLLSDVVGRNVLDGRWTFQIVEEFDDVYYEVVRAAVRQLEDELLEGRRHVFEAEMKDARRTRGHTGHERRPPTQQPDVDPA